MFERGQSGGSHSRTPTALRVPRVNKQSACGFARWEDPGACREGQVRSLQARLSAFWGRTFLPHLVAVFSTR